MSGSCPWAMVLIRLSVIYAPKALQDNDIGYQAEGLRSKS